MARQHYFWDREQMEWLDFSHKKPIARGPILLGDYKPYRNMLDGKMIDGRAAHREFLAKTGVRNVEAGEPVAKPHQIDRETLRKDIGTAYNMVSEGYKPEPCETISQFKESLDG